MGRYAREPNVMRYIKIAAMLPNRTIRDVALRCWWATVKSLLSDVLIFLPRACLIPMFILAWKKGTCILLLKLYTLILGDQLPSVDRVLHIMMAFLARSLRYAHDVCNLVLPTRFFYYLH